MELQINVGRVRRVLLADGWHAVEDVGERGSGSSFQVGLLRFAGAPSTSSAEVGDGFSFVDHHTRKRIAGPVGCIQALEIDDDERPT
jgi:hypothetical protein